MKKLYPMNIQLFADGEEGNGDPASTGNQSQAQGQTSDNGVDYNKIQTMLDNATSKKENAVLKSYFQQQGLSEDEAKQNMEAFKSQKQQATQKQQTDNTQLQEQITQAQALAMQAKVELEATKVAMTLGIDANTLPYVLKMADLSSANDKDGNISSEKVKEALNKVLADIPQLKAQKDAAKGFQIGAGQGTNQAQQTNVTTASKRWNRFN